MPAIFEKGIEFSIGSWDISLVPQAKIVLIAYAVMVAAYVLLLVNLARLTKVTPAKVLYGVFFLVYLAAIASISIYNLNCTVVGDCKTFAWILSGFISVTAIYVLWLAGLSFFMPRK